MFKILSLLILSLLSTGIYAQEKDSLPYQKHEVGFNIGLSKGVGKFSYPDFNGYDASFGGNGYSLGLTYQYRLSKQVAVSFLQGRTLNSFNNNNLASTLAMESGGTYTYDVKSANYIADYSLIGINYIFGDMNYFYINPMTGYGFIYVPEIVIQEYYVSRGLTFPEKKIRDTNYSNSIFGGISFGFIAKTIRKIDFNFDVTYLIARFNSRIENVFPGRIQMTENETAGTYKVLNIALGIKYAID